MYRILFSDETIISLYGHNDDIYVRRPKGQAFNPRYTKTSVKHSEKIAIWGCFSASGPGELHLVDGNMNAIQYREILEQHLHSSARKLGLGRRFIFQQDNGCFNQNVYEFKEWIGLNMKGTWQVPFMLK